MEILKEKIRSKISGFWRREQDFQYVMELGSFKKWRGDDVLEDEFNRIKMVFLELEQKFPDAFVVNDSVEFSDSDKEWFIKHDLSKCSLGLGELQDEACDIIDNL